MIIGRFGFESREEKSDDKSLVQIVQARCCMHIFQSIGKMRRMGVPQKGAVL